MLASEFPTWGSRVQLLLVALIAIDELAGPALFRMGLARAGELEGQARRPLIVVSNREPYLHHYDDRGGITVAPATGGVAVALDALMRERDGVWIAHADGKADRAVVDTADRTRVPPDNPSYQLRRLWFDRAEYAAYYGGFANEGLWPLCHLVDVRPKFRSEDWAAYQAVNARFAAAIDEELPTADTPVFIQDYHLALVASSLARTPPRRAHGALLAHSRGRTRIGCGSARGGARFWPGLLANDLVAFQLERDRRNFVLAVEDELEAEIEADGQRVSGSETVSARSPRFRSVSTTTASKAVGNIRSSRPNSSGSGRRSVWAAISSGWASIVSITRKAFRNGWMRWISVFSRRPELRGRLTFVQIGVPSRSDLGSYSAIEAEIDRTRPRS